MRIDPQELGLLLTSTARLDAYLDDVREWRATNGRMRRRAHLEGALPRVYAELLAAREEGDAEIADELEQVVAAFEAALADFPGPAPPTDTFVSPAEMATSGGTRVNDAADAEDGSARPEDGVNDNLPVSATSGASDDAASLTDADSQRRESQARREAAVQGVVDWERSLGGRGVTKATMEDDRELLCLVLDDCLDAGVSPTNSKVKAALMEAAPLLLHDLPRYGKFLKAVLAECRRRDAAEACAEEVADPREEAEDFERMRQNVVGFTRGKRVMMLGGRTRAKVQQELSGLLECEVTWTDSEPTDRAGKFEAEMEKADVVLMVKNFARHAMFSKGKDVMKKRGGHFIVLPSGYGVRQVVNQISGYVERASPGSLF